MTSDSAPMLLSVKLTVRYPGKAPVLRGINLEMARGEIVGLVGQSGSGKSTLAMAIMGLLGRNRAIAEGSIFSKALICSPCPNRNCANFRKFAKPGASEPPRFPQSRSSNLHSTSRSMARA